MPFEKAKVLKAAEKFLSQGKINPAIKEYRQIIQHDPDDLTALNMLGDLLARAGQKDEAVSCFTRIAEHYREQDFRLKAIAMYKKIEKLKPRDPATASSLADLYAAQGLMVDARAQYLILAEGYTRAGETKQSLGILHKIADLDPHNTDVRLKLADGYLKERMNHEAARAYADAAKSMLERGELEKALEAYSKSYDLLPNDRGILRGLLSTHIALGTPEDAAEILEKAVADNPPDMDLTSMLAEAYIQAENVAAAEKTTAQLVEHDSSNYRRYIEVARAYIKAGEPAEASRVLELVIEPMLAAREENDLVELIEELLQQYSEHVGGLRLLVKVNWWQRDMEKLRSTLERLVESAEHAGLVDDERYALTQLVRLAPDERRFSERLEALGGSLEESEETDVMSAQLLSEPSEFDVFGAVETVEEPATEVVAEEFVWNSVSEETVHDPNSSFADLNEVEFESSSGGDMPVSPETATETGAEFTFNTQLDETTDATTTESDGDRVQASMQQELESVDFYIAQGYSDIALDTLEILERQFGRHLEIDSRRKKLAGASTAAGQPREFTTDVVFETNTAESTEIEPEVNIIAEPENPPPAGTSEAAVEASVASKGIDSGLAEIFEEFRLEAEGDHVGSNEDFETHYNMATAYKEMDLLDEAIREFQTATNLTRPEDGTPRYFQCCNMLGHCFIEKGMPRAAVLWFKKGIDTPGRSSEEYKALQYELGSAYEQMNDLSRAIAAFTEVYGVDVSYRDVGERIHELQARQTSQKKKKGK
ncbi:MAG TPA: tetratricopeptide repeat protein [Pyrinomonadaceae bacterium]|nr:tetratricopeptide repeat protein [Pyrinomonadaceae bacterium]